MQTCCRSVTTFGLINVFWEERAIRNVSDLQNVHGNNEGVSDTIILFYFMAFVMLGRSSVLKSAVCQVHANFQFL